MNTIYYIYETSSFIVKDVAYSLEEAYKKLKEGQDVADIPVFVNLNGGY